VVSRLQSSKAAGLKIHMSQGIRFGQRHGSVSKFQGFQVRNRNQGRKAAAGNLRPGGTPWSAVITPGGRSNSASGIVAVASCSRSDNCPADCAPAGADHNCCAVTQRLAKRQIRNWAWQRFTDFHELADALSMKRFGRRVKAKVGWVARSVRAWLAAGQSSTSSRFSQNILVFRWGNGRLEAR